MYTDEQEMKFYVFHFFYLKVTVVLNLIVLIAVLYLKPSMFRLDSQV